MEKISWQDSSGIPGCWWNPKSIMEYIQKCRRSPCKPDRFFLITAKKRIAELMEQTGLSQSLLDTPVRRLSGGEQRRLALLRSLSISPEFLILDEVTAGLDLISTEAVLQLLEEYEQEHDCAYLVITHDLQIASRLCEVIYEIEHGKITKKAVR